MAEHSTKHSNHAASGRIRLHQGVIEKPETVVKLPDGSTMILKRTAKDTMPIFRKFNPAKFNPETGKAGGKAGTFRQPNRIPFVKFLLTAFVLHQVVGFIRRRWGSQRSTEEDEEGEEWEEEDTQAHADLLPVMMRAAMPKPQRKGRTKLLADAARSQKRPVTSAKQMMAPSKDVKRKEPGMLEKMDKAERQRVRAMIIAQQQVDEALMHEYKEQMQDQIRALPAAGILPALPPAASGTDSAASDANSAASSAAPAASQQAHGSRPGVRRR